ncbi:CPBP family intramembrane metalloprotease [Colwellia sp. MB02u-10]|uniref:CPBP family intramembrane glutamic endopeptidase n=1 Tax=Colwellia sp. MB02u-10 TaxID=2759828 RepID=UPI0015F729AF|nr:CPBP family intramembrane glutamic endopeptidase [Colwellia sp. MB02u-10]MBA6342451.1 CPBP family intramembrane metalloprotease [Colwellia sp. MB02u-10]
MQKLKQQILNQPLISAILIAVIAVAASQLIPVLLNNLFPQVGLWTFATLTRYLIAATSMLLVYRLGWNTITKPNKHLVIGSKYRWALIIPMLCVGLINLANVKWVLLQPSSVDIVRWLATNLAAGAFEETLMRGLVFITLYHAWGHTRSGLYKAAMAQAVIFGCLHLLNLVHSDPIDVIAQVLYATMLGIGFAGLMLYSRSIFSVIAVHAFINATGSINSSFILDFTPTPNEPAAYFVAIPLIFALATLPGIWGLKRVPLNCYLQGLTHD